LSELAVAPGRSASACSRRLRRLEDRRVIRGYTAIIDPNKYVSPRYRRTRVTTTDGKA